MNSADAASGRKLVYALLITVAAAATAGRILATEFVLEPSLYRSETERDDGRFVWPTKPPRALPMFSSNDRSRWATMRRLVEDGTFIIGERTKDPKTGKSHDKGLVFQDGYRSVDKVLDPKNGRDFYSSKPPLLTTLLAGEYWVLYHLGWNMEDYPWLVVRLIVLVTLWVPLVVYLILLSRLVERYGTTDWGRYFVLAAGGFATMTTLFAITLNNHVLATCTALFAMYPVLPAWESPEREPASRAPGIPRPALSRSAALLSGLFAGLTVCFELPALALAVGLFVLLLWRVPRRTLAYFLPAAVIPLAAYLAINYLAVGQVVPIQAQFGGPWYTYEGSNWSRTQHEEKHGIDWAREKENRAEYAFHVFLGHHGIFSLSPMYFLTVAGLILGLRRRRLDKETLSADAVKVSPFPRMLFALTVYLSVVVLAFYLLKTTNYGGWTNGMRWLMWLTPFWLLTMLPAADRLSGRRWGRILSLALLAVSVMSVNYRTWNPWRHPWLYNLLEALGWRVY